MAIREGERARGVRVRLIFDIVRNVPRQADLTLEYALRGAAQGGPVVALGLCKLRPALRRRRSASTSPRPSVRDSIA